MGRSTEFDQGTADTICERLEDGESLRSICIDEGMPARSTIYKWAEDIPEFSVQYAHAREEQAHKLFYEVISIADDGSKDTKTVDGLDVIDHEAIQRSRLRVDARKWAVSKILPKVYGEKQEVAHIGDLKVTVVDYSKSTKEDG